MRRPKVRDQLVVAKMKNVDAQEREVRIFANLCEVPPAVIESLDILDLLELQDVYRGFLGQLNTEPNGLLG
jgi:hypothetical protein